MPAPHCRDGSCRYVRAKFSSGPSSTGLHAVVWLVETKPSLKIDCFDVDNGLKNIIFRNKTFLFFKIESWNFQHLFETEFRETSQNFNSIRQPIEKMKITIVWISCMSWNLWGSTKFYFKQILKVSAFYLEKQKSFIPKNNIFRP